MICLCLCDRNVVFLSSTTAFYQIRLYSQGNMCLHLASLTVEHLWCWPQKVRSICNSNKWKWSNSPNFLHLRRSSFPFRVYFNVTVEKDQTQTENVVVKLSFYRCGPSASSCWENICFLWDSLCGYEKERSG